MRCGSCNGNKKVMKLGMVMGNCNICKGTGEGIPAVIVIQPTVITENAEVINIVERDVKHDGKKEDNKEQSREVKKSDCKPTTNNTKRKR